MRIVIIGAGYSACVFAQLAGSEAEAIAGTTRDAAKVDQLTRAAIEPVLFDGTEIGPALATALSQATHLLLSAAPGANGDPLLHLLPRDISAAMPALRWIGYYSTVGVYGNHDGAWVDETSVCRAKSTRAIARIEAENGWIAAGDHANVPVAVMRLAGIYGPSRNQFIKLANGAAKRVVKPGQVFNRIHVDDIAAATLHLARATTGGIFNIADDEPAPPQDVIAFAAGLMGVEAPPEAAYSDAEMTPMARSFYADNRRVSNARLKAAGYTFQHPNYRDALTGMFKDGSWHGKDKQRAQWIFHIRAPC